MFVIVLKMLVHIITNNQDYQNPKYHRHFDYLMSIYFYASNKLLTSKLWHRKYKETATHVIF